MLLAMFIMPPAYGATLSWNLPTTYVDGTPIAPEDVSRIVVKVFSGPSKGGPWQWIATSSPGETSTTVMDPPPGRTLWYTAKSTLNGVQSEYSKPVSKTNLADIRKVITQFIRKTRIPHARKIALLIFLLLLVGIGWQIGLRKKRRREGRTSPPE